MGFSRNTLYTFLSELGPRGSWAIQVCVAVTFPGCPEIGRLIRSDVQALTQVPPHALRTLPAKLNCELSSVVGCVTQTLCRDLATLVVGISEQHEGIGVDYAASVLANADHYDAAIASMQSDISGWQPLVQHYSQLTHQFCTRGSRNTFEKLLVQTQSVLPLLHAVRQLPGATAGPKSAIVRQYVTAFNQAMLGRHDVATSQLKHLRSSHPDLPPIRLGLARILLLSNRAEESLALLLQRDVSGNGLPSKPAPSRSEPPSVNRTDGNKPVDEGVTDVKWTINGSRVGPPVSKDGYGTTHLCSPEDPLMRVICPGPSLTATSGFVEQFKADAVALRHMRGKANLHRASLVGFREGTSLPYFTLPYFRGRTLDKWTPGQPGISPRFLAKLWLTLIQCLQELHDTGLYHGNIGPWSVEIRDNGEAFLGNYELGAVEAGARMRKWLADLAPEYSDRPVIKDERFDCLSVSAIIWAIGVGSHSAVSAPAFDVHRAGLVGPLLEKAFERPERLWSPLLQEELQDLLRGSQAPGTPLGRGAAKAGTASNYVDPYDMFDDERPKGEFDDDDIYNYDIYEDDITGEL